MSHPFTIWALVGFFRSLPFLFATLLWLLPGIVMADTRIEIADLRGPDQRLNVLVNGRTVTITTTLDHVQLRHFDDDQNGRLSKAEFEQHIEDINDYLDFHLRLISRFGQHVKSHFRDLAVAGFEQLTPNDDVSRVLLLRRYQLDPGDAPRALIVALFPGGLGDLAYRVRNDHESFKGVLHKQDARIIALQSSLMHHAPPGHRRERL